jgi:NADPH:quinone reductase-like Zn-dependent oxidoreductase
MKACIIDEFGGRERLRIADIPKPEVGSDEVLIRVRAAGVNPVDWKIREGYLKDLFPHEFPLIPGWDVAGEIERTGTRARRFQAGDPVYAYARLPKVQHGTYAEYITLPEAQVARKPGNLSMVEAASIPLTGLTAYQSLFDAGRLQRGDSVFILGASGGVGSSAVQLARNQGARVAALASGKNRDYLQALGAEHVIDYERGDFIQSLGEWMPNGVDLVFDCRGGDTLERGKMCVRAGGRVVSIVESEGGKQLADRDVRFAYVFVAPNSEQLDRIREKIEAGDFKANVSATFDLEEVAEAHRLVESGHTRGKIVLKIG